MFMQFQGGGIRHLITYKWNSLLQSNEHAFNNSKKISEMRNGEAGEVGKGKEGKDEKAGKMDEEEEGGE